MSTWTKQKLGDVLEVSTGYPFKSNTFVASGEYGLVTIRNVQENRFDGSCDSRIDAIPDNVPKFCFLNEGDILLSLTGNVGRVCRVADGKYLLNQRVAKLSPKEGNNPNFLFSYLRQPAFRHRLENISNGVAQMNLSPIEMQKLEVDFPDLPTQTRIASVLSTYDDLIENNEKRIKALEEMAQLLYTEWFVKFKFPGHEKVKLIDSGTEYGKIPEGWEVKKLGDLIQIKKGKNITKETVSKGEIPVVAGGLEPAYFHDTPNTKSPVVTISASGANAGFTRLYFEDVWASDCSFVDLGVTPYVYFYYLFLINRQADISRLQRGSAQPHVYPKDLMELNIIDPTEKVIKDFNDKVATLFQLIGGVRRKNQTLSKTRDLLIPQLVTGKRELKNI